MNSNVVMIVEDDAEIREGIRILLGGEGYIILEADSGEKALDMMNDSIDLIILDIVLPKMSGLNVCENIRKISSVPILFLTAKALDSDKALALTLGGDDYLSKPFSYAELIARVKAQLRRYCVYRGKIQSATAEKKEILEFGRIKLALNRNEIWKDGYPIELTEIEYGILLLLMRNPQRIFSASVIYEYVWNEPYSYNDNGTIMVHIRKLRKKIEDDPQKPHYIINVWGKGYLIAAMYLSLIQIIFMKII